MIVGALLCLGAWLAVGVVGAPVDPFLPLVAATALYRPWPAWARIAAATSLGPIAAAACGDVAPERTALYAAIGLVATRAGWTLRDGIAARTALVAGTLVVVLGVRALLAALGAAPGPGQALVGVAATIAWTAAHAALSRGIDRGAFS